MDAVIAASAKSNNATKEFTKWLERKNAEDARFPMKKKGIIKSLRQKLQNVESGSKKLVSNYGIVM